MESSSKGFMECLTPWVSTAVPVLLTRGLTWMQGDISGFAEGIRKGTEKGGKRESTYGIVDDPFDGDQNL